jgi:Flp pilus assembly protein TadD
MKPAIGVCGSSLLALVLAACATTSTTPTGQAAFVSPEEARLVGLARDIESRGESGTALALYERAAEIAKESPAAQARLGEARLKVGDADGAAEAFEAALVRDQSFAPALLGLGTVKLNRGETAEAVRRLSVAAPQVKTATAYNRLGTALTLDGRPSEAKAAYATARQLDPQNIDIAANTALAEALSGEFEPAVQRMRAVAQSPLAKPRHHRNLIVVLTLAGRDAEATAVSAPDMNTRQKAAFVAQAKKLGAIVHLGERARAIGLMASG